MPVGIQDISPKGGSPVNVKERSIPDFMFVSKPQTQRMATSVAEEVPDEQARTYFPIQAHH